MQCSSLDFYLPRANGIIILPLLPALQVLLLCPPFLSRPLPLLQFRNDDDVLGAKRTEQTETPNNIQSWVLLPRYELILQLPMPPSPSISCVLEIITGGKHAPPIIACIIKPAPRFVCLPKPAIPRVNMVGKHKLYMMSVSPIASDTFQRRKVTCKE